MAALDVRHREVHRCDMSSAAEPGRWIFEFVVCMVFGSRSLGVGLVVFDLGLGIWGSGFCGSG